MKCLADGCYQYGEGAQHRCRKANITYYYNYHKTNSSLLIFNNRVKPFLFVLLDINIQHIPKNIILVSSCACSQHINSKWRTILPVADNTFPA